LVVLTLRAKFNLKKITALLFTAQILNCPFTALGIQCASILQQSFRISLGFALLVFKAFLVLLN